MAAAGHPPRGIDCLEILGDAGRISLGPAGLRCDGPRPASLPVDFDADYQAAYTGAVTHFAESILAGEPFETPPQAHIAILEMVEAAYASAQLAPSPPHVR
jgi:predicted dehydrogenase